ncbi:hypothetical protein [Arenibacter sp. P308M17]|uniref:hypothetical protein n=1 Tax=Arenibacter sp. P308M17 TaxID=2303391 RepID=UPI000E353A12|nr:hypothetical protein [Arenibacter sp. P308M17]MCM4164795.1 hypothetical protein [Arenibacter sp. A80]RFT55861.1 hypothetical protein D0S24_14415 [Arenibacter sp. P308M17]
MNAVSFPLFQYSAMLHQLDRKILLVNATTTLQGFTPNSVKKYQAKFHENKKGKAKTPSLYIYQISLGTWENSIP